MVHTYTIVHTYSTFILLDILNTRLNVVAEPVKTTTYKYRLAHTFRVLIVNSWGDIRYCWRKLWVSPATANQIAQVPIMCNSIFAVIVWVPRWETWIPPSGYVYHLLWLVVLNMAQCLDLYGCWAYKVFYTNCEIFIACTTIPEIPWKCR